MICVAPNPEGVAKNHENLLEIGYKPHAQIVEMVQQGKVDDLVGVAILADVCQIIDKTDCIMVSPGVKPDEAKKLGFEAAIGPRPNSQKTSAETFLQSVADVRGALNQFLEKD